MAYACPEAYHMYLKLDELRLYVYGVVHTFPDMFPM